MDSRAARVDLSAAAHTRRSGAFPFPEAGKGNAPKA